jgi:hypothetical protein
MTNQSSLKKFFFFLSFSTVRNYLSNSDLKTSITSYIYHKAKLVCYFLEKFILPHALYKLNILNIFVPYLGNEYTSKTPYNFFYKLCYLSTGRIYKKNYIYNFRYLEHLQ